MMPGHLPPGGPFHQGRKQDLHPYPAPYHYPQPPQAPAPLYHNPYAPYHHPQHYGPPHAYPPQMPHLHQWSPYHQPQPQYNMPPRQFQPHASPVVVSSHPHMAALPPVSRALGQTPPLHPHTPPLHAHTPPVHTHTPPLHAHTPPVHTHTPPVHAHTPPVHTPTPPVLAHTPPVASPPPPPPQPATFKPFYPPLPWLSVPDAAFPPRAAGRRRRKRGPVLAEEQDLALPSRGQHVHDDPGAVEETGTLEHESAGEPEESQASTVAVPSDAEVDTPSTSHPPSEVDVPSVQHAAAQTTAAAPKHTRNTTKPAVPLLPLKPVKAASAASTAQKSVKSPPKAADEPATTTDEAPKPAPPAAPKSWAELVRAQQAAAAPQTQAQAQPPATQNGVASTSAPAVSKSNSLAHVLASYAVGAEKKVSFIEPRGLVNTGNLCYMNSVRLHASHNNPC